MESDSEEKQKSKSSTSTSSSSSFRVNRKLFAHLLWVGISLIIISFLLYRFLLLQAFSDRGVSRNFIPAHIVGSSNKMKENVLLTAQQYFKCTNPRKVDISHFNSVGMFPYLLKSDLDTCNKSTDFVGYEKFISAMLHGEEHLGRPASSSKSLSYNHHHPGLQLLKSLLEAKKKYDRSVEFYWWIFPVPMGIPNRGLSYAIFKGDYAGLEKAARQISGSSFFDILTDGLKVFAALQGWDLESGKPFKESPLSYDEKDHVVTKAWISIHCFHNYILGTDYDQREKVNKLLHYKASLETFMQSKLIRYPSDFSC